MPTLALKQSKKGPKDLDEEDLAFKEKQKAAAQAKKEMASKAKKGGPLVGGGIKKYVFYIFKSIILIISINYLLLGLELEEKRNNKDINIIFNIHIKSFKLIFSQL